MNKSALERRVSQTQCGVCCGCGAPPAGRTPTLQLFWGKGESLPNGADGYRDWPLFPDVVLLQVCLRPLSVPEKPVRAVHHAECL